MTRVWTLMSQSSTLITTPPRLPTNSFWSKSKEWVVISWLLSANPRCVNNANNNSLSHKILTGIKKIIPEKNVLSKLIFR